MSQTNRLLRGIPASPGIVQGTARVLTHLAHVPTRLLFGPEEMAQELERFRAAVDRTEEDLIRLKEEISDDLQEHAYILDLHLMILRDRMLLLETEKLIQEENFNAERALHQAFIKIKDVFQRIDDKHIRGRAADVEAVCRRLLARLSGRDPSRPFSIQEPVIVVARDLSPADTTQMAGSPLLGFITERGGKTSHTAIIAQSLEIPAVVGLDNATMEIETGDELILDGLTGQVIINPDGLAQRNFKVRRAEFEVFKSEVSLGSAMPAATWDNHPIRVLANIELPEEVPVAQKYGADGVGLLRTEFLYLRRRQAPTEEELFQECRRVAEDMAPRQVTIRTLDIGGDKFLSPLEYPPEMNPALGLRAIRFSLKEPKIFRIQLRAILRASAFGRVRIMFPLISSPREMMEGRRILASVKEELYREGLAFDPDLPVGAMIEVPAAVTLADLLTDYADFFSIGTNDLIQYALAIDRVNKQVADMYQPLHPAVLRMVRDVVQAGRNADIPVAMCGEMAGDPLNIPVLLGLGVEELSMNALAIPVVKRVIRTTSLAEAQELARQALLLPTVEEVNSYVIHEMDRRFPDIFRFARPLANNIKS
jgi:phosphotransferase system enzyme I (PtsI)